MRNALGIQTCCLQGDSLVIRQLNQLRCIHRKPSELDNGPCERTKWSLEFRNSIYVFISLECNCSIPAYFIEKASCCPLPPKPGHPVENHDQKEAIACVFVGSLCKHDTMSSKMSFSIIQVVGIFVRDEHCHQIDELQDYRLRICRYGNELV